MHRKTNIALTILALVIGSGLIAVRAVGQGAAEEARWKLVVLAYGNDDFVVLSAKPDGTAKLVSVQERLLGETTIARFEKTDAAVTLVLDNATGTNEFTGKLVAEGKNAGSYVGSIFFRDSHFPAALRPTQEEEVEALSPSPFLEKLRAAVQQDEPQAAVKAVEAVISEADGHPSMHQAYNLLLQRAEVAELTPEQVEAHVNQLLADAAVYGPNWSSQVRLIALGMISSQDSYAVLSLRLAQSAQKELDETGTTDQRAALAKIIVRTARLTGDEELVLATELRLEQLEAQLDAEYLASVPPFEAEPFAGRKDKANDNVMLFELFTGAECPPCVAADVAFDALLERYEPTEFIGLQYHLHIPGPDPLTNPDTDSRSDYYKLRGTPSAYFNGQQLFPGGGGMAASEAMFGQYQSAIDDALEKPRSADIELKVTRTGDRVEIAATASADVAAGDDEEKPELRLRFALTEESIRYVGGNGLRFHHHVVRSMPGGTNGQEFDEGNTEAKLLVNLDEVRRGIDAYLGQYSGGAAFSGGLPEFHLDELAVVAFVQDDRTKDVLHAVTVEVPPGH